MLSVRDLGQVLLAEDAKASEESTASSVFLRSVFCRLDSRAKLFLFP